jgi:hypothetical protein
MDDRQQELADADREQDRQQDLADDDAPTTRILPAATAFPTTATTPEHPEIAS